jgi:hypothetical protein
MGIKAPSIGEGAIRHDTYFDTRATNASEALAFFEQSLREVLKSAVSLGLRVLLVLSSPVQRYAAAHCLAINPSAGCSVSVNEMTQYAGAVETVMRRLASEFEKNVHVLDPKEFMCDAHTCPAVLDGTIVYSDDDHIGATFSRASAPHFAPQLKWLRGDEPGPPFVRAGNSPVHGSTHQ